MVNLMVKEFVHSIMETDMRGNLKKIGFKDTESSLVKITKNMKNMRVIGKTIINTD